MVYHILACLYIFCNMSCFGILYSIWMFVYMLWSLYVISWHIALCIDMLIQIMNLKYRVLLWCTCYKHVQVYVYGYVHIKLARYGKIINALLHFFFQWYQNLYVSKSLLLHGMLIICRMPPRILSGFPTRTVCWDSQLYSWVRQRYCMGISFFL